jgi:hypothetical protein
MGSLETSIYMAEDNPVAEKRAPTNRLMLVCCLSAVGAAMAGWLWFLGRLIWSTGSWIFS